jgi:cytochrome c oxidase subunit 2
VNQFLRRILFLPPQMSTVAYDVDWLHYFVILWTMAGAVLVTLVGGWFVIHYRSRAHAPEEANPDALSRPRPFYKVAALVGLAALFLLFWSIGLRTYVRMRVAPENAMVVYVSAKKWMWKFAYPAGSRSIARLYVPVGRPVLLYLTSRDVIHSLFVPAFRVKQDAVPGRYTTMWFQAVAPGTYPAFCTQYCGTGHSTMRAEVVALPPEDFERWLHGQDPEGARLAGPRYVEPQLGLTDAAPAQDLSMVRQGERVAAEHGCLRCHTLDGTPHLGPTWAGVYESLVPLADGSEVVADVAYLTESMMDPLAKIHRGYQPLMPSYLGKLGAGEVAALVELIKSLRDTRAQPGAITPLDAQPDAGAAEDDDLQGQGERRSLQAP